ncbi:MAG: hypothetical protein P9L93_02050 [Candidatus Gorgyraea atricola]|nr:hypothetical protein [Candidatus Gorgyraea atricola]
MNKSKTPPPEWGNDKITEFFETARENSFATFVKDKPFFKCLVDIENLFRSAIDSMGNSEHWFPLFFFLKAHSAFLAALRLVFATQIPEAFMVLRGVIENSLYGFYIYKNPKLAPVWLSRHRDKKSMKAVKEKFKAGFMLQTLKTTDPALEKAARELYDRTIDYGAHPNERSLSLALKRTDVKNGFRFDLRYLTDDALAIEFCLKCTAQIGVLSLKILQLITPERFKIAELDTRLEKISKAKIFSNLSKSYTHL